MEYCADQEIFYYSTLSCSALSFFGSLTVIVAFLKLKRYQTYSLRLLFYLSISDFFKAIGLSVPCFYLTNEIYIKIAAFMGRTGNLCSSLWAVAIVNALYKIVVNGTQKFDYHHRFWVILTIGLIAFNSGISFLDIYSNIVSTCTFIDSFLGNALRFGTIFVPDWLLLIYNMFAYFKVQNKIKTLPLTIGKSLAIKRLFVFSMISFLCALPLSIIRIMQIFYQKSCLIAYLGIITFSANSLRGFINALAYLWAFKNFASLIGAQVNFERSISINSSETEGKNLLYESFTN
ncbi:hypothetical protein SteCoe_30639 [Stentor coeruleus]|uniref:G-protein coupled receptors family 1 profile domain-containing protein n=1 Tax=Stentor coeruleus TaxID=5963 RepID=A0A1R2B362_9CILI|nr:hypothetical protein SteCoe_30639 [Stentor coeruleus]